MASSSAVGHIFSLAVSLFIASSHHQPPRQRWPFAAASNFCRRGRPLRRRPSHCLLVIGRALHWPSREAILAADFIHTLGICNDFARLMIPSSLMSFSPRLQIRFIPSMFSSDGFFASFTIYRGNDILRDEMPGDVKLS